MPLYVFPICGNYHIICMLLLFYMVLLTVGFHNVVCGVITQPFLSICGMLARREVYHTVLCECNYESFPSRNAALVDKSSSNI